MLPGLLWHLIFCVCVCVCLGLVLMVCSREVFVWSLLFEDGLLNLFIEVAYRKLYKHAAYGSCVTKLPAEATHWSWFVEAFCEFVYRKLATQAEISMRVTLTMSERLFSFVLPRPRPWPSPFFIYWIETDVFSPTSSSPASAFFSWWHLFFFLCCYLSFYFGL